jgi:hypothetical protein
MKQFTMFTAMLLAVAGAASGQQPQLYTPRSIDAAVARGTRTHTGAPGNAYWQNKARYTIRLSVAPPNREVRGSERIVYFNNSPDTLGELTVRLFMNIHKPGAPRNIATTPDYLTGGVSIDSFAIDGHATEWHDDGYFTWVPVKLSRPVHPRDSVQLDFTWRYTLAKPAREGAIDSTTYFLAYFYPRIAVYDDYNGWDQMDFTDLQEFYSDFNDYDVTVEAPGRFIVWGTGTLRNAAEILRPAYAARLDAASRSDTTIHIATRTELATQQVTAAPLNAWHFVASNIPDVAFGVSDHYDWDAASVRIRTGRRVGVHAAYNDSAADFHSMVQMARQSLAFLSSTWPGITYPYEKTTIFQGGAGMEYPMMVNDEAYADTALSHFVAGHEIAHTYMPFYMGINETRYAFMDEGWATTFEYLLNRRNMGDAWAEDFFVKNRISPWVRDPSPPADLPIITPADAIRNPTYRMNAYAKAALGYLAVKDFIGDSAFRAGLHGYMAAWQGKHPTPWDFFNSFNAASGRDLGWFWKNWYFDNGYIDLALRDVKRTSEGYSVVLENRGGFAAPVDLVATYSDGSTETFHETIGIWKANQRTSTVMLKTRKMISTLMLSGGIWMDAERRNDTWNARRR